MKKAIAVLFVFVLVIAISVPCFAVNDIAPKSVSYVTLPSISIIEFYGASGHEYSINVNTDYVGFNRITTGDPVSLCQAYTLITGGGLTDDDVDGIWGVKSDTALRTAQGILGNVYSVVAADGVCGPNTWKAFYGYNGGTPQSLKNLL